MNLARVEPQSRQLIARRVTWWRRQAIAIAFAIPDDRCMQAAAHVFDVPLEGGERDVELIEEAIYRNVPVLPQQPIGSTLAAFWQKQN